MNSFSQIATATTNHFIAVSPVFFWIASLFFVLIFFTLMTLLFFYLKEKQKYSLLLKNQTLKNTQSEQLYQILHQLQSTQNDLKGRLGQIFDVQHSSQLNLSKNIDDRLEKMSYRMVESLSKTSEKTGENLSKLHERLALINQAKEQMLNLTDQVSDLKEIFSSHKKRGIFGEVHMQDMIQTYLPPKAYSFQTTLPNKKRVDALIHLADSSESIAIDAKFPLEFYQNLMEAKTEEQQKTYTKLFRNSVHKHILDISKRYLIPGTTLEPALLFLPSEAIYFELYNHHYELIEKGFQKRVLIVSPTTFMATLATMRNNFKKCRFKRKRTFDSKTGFLDSRRYYQARQKNRKPSKAFQPSRTGFKRNQNIIKTNSSQRR